MSNEKQDNLLSIKDNNKKATTQKNSEKKAKPLELGHGELEAHLIKYLTRESNEHEYFGPGLLCLPEHELYKFKVYVPDENSEDYQILHFTDDGFVREISKGALAGKFDRQVAVFAYYPETLTAKYCFSGHHVSKMVNKILRSGINRIHELPLPYGYLSDKGHFFERRNYDPVLNSTPDKFPFLESYLKRITNRKAFCQVIGSILAGRVLRKSPIALYGDTGAGKSIFCRFLKKLIGEKRLGVCPKTIKDIYSHGYVDNGTVAYFSDEANCDYFFTNEFKEISGSDVFPVRKMNRDYKVVPIRGVYIFNLNVTQLRLPKDDAVVRGRIVPCYISTTPEWDSRRDIKNEGELFARAEAEFQYFSGYCINLFKELKGGAVKYDLGDFESYCVDESDMDLETLFETSYEFIADYNIPGLATDRELVTRSRFVSNWEAIARQYPIATKDKTHHDLIKFIAFKQNIKGSMVKTIRKSGKYDKVIRGIKEKNLKY